MTSTIGVYTTKAIAAIERNCAIEPRVLMLRAAQAMLSDIMLNWPTASKVLIFAGSGNNGGDGYTLALLLRGKGFRVHIVAVLAKTREAQFRRKQCEEKEIVISSSPCEQMQADLIVDALLGCGLKGTPKDEMAAWIDWINDKKKTGTQVLSCDIPSGLNADTGYAQKAVFADRTVSFIALKPGLVTGAAVRYCGKIRVDSIGVNAYDDAYASLLSEEQALLLLPERYADEHKYQAGSVRITGAGPGMCGAGILAATAAMRTGAGVVSLLSDSPAREWLPLKLPELLIGNAHQERSFSVELIGPGLGTCEQSSMRFEKAMSHAAAKVIDADGLHWLALSSQPCRNCVLTPHTGEAAKLLGISASAVQEDRFKAARLICEKYAAICVLKGPGTIIADGVDLWICDQHHQGMATAGMGDVLAGTIAGLLAQGGSALNAALLGVWVHGSAAVSEAKEQGSLGQISSDLPSRIRSHLTYLYRKKAYGAHCF